MTGNGFDAIVLAGGRASRLGGAQKPLLVVGGRTLLTRTVAAARSAGAERVIVVGERMLDDPLVQWVREDPPFGGPVAAIVAALPRVEADWTLVLACDLPGVGQALALLPLDASDQDGADQDGPDHDGAHLTDASGRSQWLTALYRTAALREAAASVPDGGHGVPVRDLVGGLRLRSVGAPATATRDVDTWEDLEWARALANKPGEGAIVSESETPSGSSGRTLPPEALDAWANALGERFEISNDDVHVGLILDLARDVANGVARPAAPVSAFVAGLVAGRAGGSPESIREAVRAITELAENWAETH